MIRALAFALALLPFAARAGQIDYLAGFPSEAAAQADPAWGRYWIPPSADGPGAWRPDICIPNIFVWAPAADVIVGTDPDTGQPITQHVPYDALWRVTCSFTADQPALDASAATELVTDRDAAAAGRPFVRQSSLPDGALDALALSPLYAGSAYPFGAVH